MGENVLPAEPPNTAHDRSPIGLQRGLVRLVPYSTAWDHLFAAEAAAVRAALGDRALQIEHVGSTAVAGMTAKPILDIVVAILRLSDGPGLVATLLGIGYEHIPEDPVVDREFLVKGPPGTRQIHLSLTAPDSACWRSHVLFRDRLRLNPTIAADYAALKKRLAARHPADRAAYTAGKAAFIERVLDAALHGDDQHEP